MSSHAFRKWSKSTCPLVCIYLALAIAPAQMATAQVAIPRTDQVGLVLKRTTLELYSVVDHSADSGDLFTLKAALDLIFSLSAWHHVNKEKLDLTFDALNLQDNSLLTNAHSLTKQFRNKAYSAAENLKTAKTLAGQLVQSVPQESAKTLIFSYQPFVLPKEENEFIDLQINGVNLAAGQTTLYLQNKLPPRQFSRAARTTNESTKIVFRLKRSEFPTEEKIRAHAFMLSYQQPRDGFFSRLLLSNESIVREISFFTLPQHLATYDLEINHVEQTYESKPFTSLAKIHEGSDQTATGLALPENGWQWDTSKPITPITSDENHGRFEKITRKDENGIEYMVRLDHQPKTGQLETAKRWPGKIRVSLMGTIRKAVTINQTVKMPGVLGWSKDIKVDLPGEKPHWKLKLKLFDGSVREFSDSSPLPSDLFFTIQTSGKSLLIKPHIPRELLD